MNDRWKHTPKAMALMLLLCILFWTSGTWAKDYHLSLGETATGNTTVAAGVSNLVISATPAWNTIALDKDIGEGARIFTLQVTGVTNSQHAQAQGGLGTHKDASDLEFRLKFSNVDTSSAWSSVSAYQIMPSTLQSGNTKQLISMESPDDFPDAKHCKPYYVSGATPMDGVTAILRITERTP